MNENLVEVVQRYIDSGYVFTPLNLYDATIYDAKTEEYILYAVYKLMELIPSTLKNYFRFSVYSNPENSFLLSLTVRIHFSNYLNVGFIIRMSEFVNDESIIYCIKTKVRKALQDYYTGEFFK